MGKVHDKLIIGRVKMLLRRNCGIIISESEIDCGITISENYFHLKDKYLLKNSLNCYLESKDL